jgi:hypothetical protein
MRVAALVTYLGQTFPSLMDTFSLEPEQIISHDRSILENIILPYLAADSTIQKVLFVGCAAYTRSYEDILKEKDYWTIDPKRVKKKYGAKRHIVDSITRIDKHVPKNYFDVIMMNGVIGFGLNRIDDIEQAIHACYLTLASPGILLVGWNNVAHRTPIDIEALQALRAFHQYYFKPLQACHYRTEGSQRHTYSFYRKA